MQVAGPIKAPGVLMAIGREFHSVGWHRRNMATTPACNMCRVHDSWKHALLDCPMSRSTWALSSKSILDQLSVIQIDNAKEWIFAMGKALIIFR